ncbi:MAG TPA: hypothetical protein PKE45_12060 [Caldilineaceae bacterium]|nr:hypothetical protein [Caldilineaceae bacterium]
MPARLCRKAASWRLSSRRVAGRAWQTAENIGNELHEFSRIEKPNSNNSGGCPENLGALPSFCCFSVGSRRSKAAEAVDDLPANRFMQWMTFVLKPA